MIIKIDIEGPVFSQISFAHVVRSIAFALEDIGCEISLLPTDKHSDGYKNVAGEKNFDRLTSMVNRSPGGQIRILYNFPINMRNRCKGYNFAITSWETTSAPSEWIAELNATADQIWSISAFVNEAFIAGGLNPTKAKILPMGFDSSLFNSFAKPKIYDTEKEFKFLHLGVAQIRKGTPLLLSAYSKAFTNKDDVVLIIKSNGFGQIHNLVNQYKKRNGAEILYLYEETHENNIPGFYTGANCFVYPVHAEGAGLPVLESLACGRPAIVPLYSGLLDFCDQNSCFAIKHKESPLAKPYSNYSGSGVETWAELSENDLIEQMRYAFHNKKIVEQKGEYAANYVKDRFGWHNTALKILSYINEFVKNDKIKLVIENQPAPSPVKLAPLIRKPAQRNSSKIGILASFDVFSESYYYAKLALDYSFTHVVGFASQNIKNNNFIRCFQPGMASAHSIIQKCNENGINILQIHWDRSLLPAPVLPSFLRVLHDAGIRIILNVHDEMPENLPFEFFYLARFFLVNSLRLRNHLLQKGCPLDKIKYLTPVRFEIDTSSRQKTRNVFNIGDKNFVISSPVYLDDDSSCIETMRRCHTLISKHPHLRYCVVVLGGNKKLIEEHVQEQKKCNNATFIVTSLENENKFNEVLSIADAFYFPYKSKMSVPKNPSLIPAIGLGVPVAADIDCVYAEYQNTMSFEDLFKPQNTSKEMFSTADQYIQLIESVYYNLSLETSVPVQTQSVNNIATEILFDIDSPIVLSEL